MGRYFRPTYERLVLCTFASSVQVPHDFSHTNAHKHACAFMHKYSHGPPRRNPSRCYLTEFLHRVKRQFHKVSSEQMPPLCCYDVDTVEGGIRLPCLLFRFVPAVSIPIACAVEQSRWSHQTTAAAVKGPENM